MKTWKTPKASKAILTRLRRYFPQINNVMDASESVEVEVIKEDVLKGAMKRPQSCALARACVRSKDVDGAIINIGNSYLIKGDTAVRFNTSEAVGREITSFDRHGDFAVGKSYVLGRIAPKQRLGRYKAGQKSKGGPRLTTKPPENAIHKRHRTVRIRVSKAA